MSCLIKSSQLLLFSAEVLAEIWTFYGTSVYTMENGEKGQRSGVSPGKTRSHGERGDDGMEVRGHWGCA